MGATVNSDLIIFQSFGLKGMCTLRNIPINSHFKRNQSLLYLLLIISPHICKYEKVSIPSIKCTFLILLLFPLICAG